jgi:ubiquinone/menaquinone biosynthesis C-methylase UbiE
LTDTLATASSALCRERLRCEWLRLRPYIDPAVELDQNMAGVLAAPIATWTKGMKANRDFFNRVDWALQYIRDENSGENFRSRYQAAIAQWDRSGWDSKIVVDVGCGPGNVWTAVGGQPRLMIGVDIAANALKMARQVGYVPLLADAQNLPLIDQCADVVVANATLHHCDDMARVLAEAARLVKPGGLLITDQDPQMTAWQFRGWGFWFHHAKYSPLFPLYRQLVGRPLGSWNQQMARFHTEIHNQFPGDGVRLDLYRQVLAPLGFEYQLFPHNHTLGAAVLQGEWGVAPRLIRSAQWLSGMDSTKIESAQSVMCVARRI